MEKETTVSKIDLKSVKSFISFFGAMLFFIGLFSLLLVLLSYFTPSVIFDENQSTYTEILEFCNSNLVLYIDQNEDYSTCQTQDECDLKSLKLSLLQKDVFECMNQSWEER